MRRFVADASHELRTPLSAIRGEADVALALDRSPAEYKESLAIIQDEARRLSRLVEDLLNLARADAGKVRLRVEEFYLNDLLAECCRSIQPRAAAKSIAVERGPSEDVQFRGDEELLRRLILNLLDNALRYTPEGGRITVALDAEPDRLALRVSDTGIGIPPEAAPHVFERFYRADKARSRQDGGFGLGLAVVKWIAEAHNGSGGTPKRARRRQHLHRVAQTVSCKMQSGAAPRAAAGPRPASAGRPERPPQAEGLPHFELARSSLSVC